MSSGQVRQLKFLPDNALMAELRQAPRTQTQPQQKLFQAQ
jgi:hypothetical protein